MKKITKLLIGTLGATIAISSIGLGLGLGLKNSQIIENNDNSFENANTSNDILNSENTDDIFIEDNNNNNNNNNNNLSDVVDNKKPIDNSIGNLANNNANSSTNNNNSNNNNVNNNVSSSNTNDQTNNNINSSSNNNNNNTQVVKPQEPTKPQVQPESSKIKSRIQTFSIDNSNSSNQDSNIPTNTPIQSAKRITKEFVSGYVETPVADTIAHTPLVKESLYQSPYYYNQRDFMPILSSSRMWNYPNERTTFATLTTQYNGWNKNESYFNKDGHALSSKKDYTAITYSRYTPTNELKANFQNVQSEIRAIEFNCSKMGNQNANSSDQNNDQLIADQINNYLNGLQERNKIEFITLRNPTQATLEKIVIPSGIKKLTILDFNEWKRSQLTSFRGITIPNTVQELEFYSNTCKRIDPLILSSETHMIYDHISDKRNYNIDLANFNTIDLSSHSDLTEEQLQKAINAVYIERQYERNFQGDFTGGYISNLDISNTPIKSLNNVYIPSQSDGRFNIAYVQWSNGSSSDSITVNITKPSQYPSNDSLVNEWWDSSLNSNVVTKLFLESEVAVSLDVAKVEIIANFKKYSSISEVNLNKLELADGTFEELVAKVKEKLEELNFDVSKIIFLYPTFYL